MFTERSARLDYIRRLDSSVFFFFFKDNQDLPWPVFRGEGDTDSSMSISQSTHEAAATTRSLAAITVW